MTFIYILFLLFIFFIILWIVLRYDRNKDYDTYVNLYFGLPGSGKSTFLTRDIVKSAASGHKCFVANLDLVSIPNVYKITKNDIGSYKFPPGSRIFFDEASLNGYDNRDFSKNFKGNNSLPYIKYIRHYRNQITFSNQGYEEFDKKLRNLTNKLWYVRGNRFFTYAILISKTITIDKETKQIIDGYAKPSIFQMLFSTRVVRILSTRKYRKFYDSYCPAPGLENIPNYPN